MKFTKNQILDWRDFEEVKLCGEFNMDSYQARKETKLSKERYLFVKNNYKELRKQAERIILSRIKLNSFPLENRLNIY